MSLIALTAALVTTLAYRVPPATYSGWAARHGAVYSAAILRASLDARWGLTLACGYLPALLLVLRQRPGCGTPD